MCDFGCSSDRFGKYCETCEEYMGRVDFDSDPYFKFMDVTEVCKGIPDPDYCSKNLNCYSCQSTKGCIFDNNVCRNGTAFEQVPSLRDIYNT